MPFVHGIRIIFAVITAFICVRLLFTKVLKYESGYLVPYSQEKKSRRCNLNSAFKSITRKQQSEGHKQKSQTSQSATML